MKIIQGHPIVPTFVKQTALAYYEHEMLYRFCTTFIEHPEFWLSSWFSKIHPGLHRELQRRSAAELPYHLIRKYPFREIVRTFASRYLGTVATDFIWEWSELAFDRWVASQVDKSTDAIHVYEHAGLAALQRAKALGVLAIYEQPSQHHTFFTRIAEEQFKKYPELKSAGTSLLVDEKSRRRNARRDEELATADVIVCNSTFTKRTLVGAGVDASRIQVVPYGFPPRVEEVAEKPVDRPLVFLNAGTQNLRKAIHLLYRAWRQCDFKPEEAELWLIGKMALPEETRKDLPGKVIIRESIPRNELMTLYRQADVFVLPTLADGFGMVISEAMSRGLAVITTGNSGGPDITTDGVDGIHIAAGDEHVLIEKMKWCVANREKVREIGFNAWVTSGKYQWSEYRKKIAGTVKDILMARRGVPQE